VCYLLRHNCDLFCLDTWLYIPLCPCGISINPYFNGYG
jgi:hypothetical protein